MKLTSKMAFLGVLMLFGIFSSCSQQAVQREASTENNPPITPKWLIGHIVWEDSINTQAAALDLNQQYKDHSIPVNGIIIDSPWELSYNDFNWDTARYPEPKKMIDAFKLDDVKVILWLTGCINITARDVPVPKSPDYDFVIENKYVVNNGKPSEWWKGEGVHLDFTNPEAVKWWDNKLDNVFIDGVYGWKVDQGEATFADSLSLTEEFRYQAQNGHYYGDSIMTSKGRMSMLEFKHAYYDHMFDYATSHNPAGIIIARPYSHQAGYAASINKLSLGWSGDFEGNYEGLKLQIDNIYKSAIAGYGALGCEVGGFYRARSTKAQFIRYTQFGSMTACMVNGGSNGAFTNHLPWYHDEETTDIFRYYVTLHHQLSPYIFSTIVETHLHSGSMLKNISIEQQSHTMGDDIFFKSITSDTNLVTYNLPQKGAWIDFWTDEKYAGGSEITKEYGLEIAPLFIKSGAIIPLEISNDVTGIGDDSFTGKTSVLIYPDGNSEYLYHKPLGEGIEYEDILIQYNNDVITVNAENEDSYIFLVKTNIKPVNISGSDTWIYNADNQYVQIEKTGDCFELILK